MIFFFFVEAPLWEGHNSRLLRGGELTTGAWLPVFWLSPVSPPHVEQRSERPVGPVGVDRVALRHFWKKSPFLISLLTGPHFHSRGIPAFYVTRLFASKVLPGRSRVHSRKADRERERKKAKKKKVCLRIYLFSLYLERAGRIELQSDFEITDGGPRGRVGGAVVSQRRGCHYCCGRLSREGGDKKKKKKKGLGPLGFPLQRCFPRVVPVGRGARR